VNTIEFDENFLNFENPDVFERFVGPDLEKYMKLTYGYDYAMKVNPVDIDFHTMTKYCAESESRYNT
jgi:hypothetical protein